MVFTNHELDPYPHRVRVKDEPTMLLTIEFVRHRVEPLSGDVTYAWAKGDVWVTVPDRMGGAALGRAFAHVLRATPHWAKANTIEVEIMECTYDRCLCLTAGAVSPGGVGV